jgi:cytochrome P450
VEAAIYEAMRMRSVIPSVGRRVTVRRQLGKHRVPAGTPVTMRIVLPRHGEDVHPRSFTFELPLFLGMEPGIYTSIPLGDGIRRCPGATLATAEQRIVLRAVAQRTDTHAPNHKPEGLRFGNVTMVPAKDAPVVLDAGRVG